MRAYTKRWVISLFEAVGEPAPMTGLQAFMVRQSLLRAWGKFQESHPLIVAPIGSEIPFEVAKDRTVAEVAETLRAMRMAMAVNALGLPGDLRVNAVRDY